MPTLETAPTAVATFTLQQTRVIHASRARVYEAWTNPEIMKAWFGCEGTTCANAELDVRVGGAYRIDIHHPAETANSATGDASTSRRTAVLGHYTKLVPNELVQFTWSPSWNPDERSLVTVSLKDADGGTEVTILHEGFTSEGSREAHSKGWTEALVKIAQILER